MGRRFGVGGPAIGRFEVGWQVTGHTGTHRAMPSHRRAGRPVAG